MTRGTLLVAASLSAVAAGCGPRTLEPAALDTSVETCRHCRMAVSDPQFAAQLVAPGEDVQFFDDIGCLRDHLRTPGPPRGAVAFVTEHRTRRWIPAATAVFTEVAAVETPMGSHLIAHESAGSRDADPSARGGRPVNERDVLGPLAGAGGPP